MKKKKKKKLKKRLREAELDLYTTLGTNRKYVQFIKKFANAPHYASCTCEYGCLQGLQREARLLLPPDMSAQNKILKETYAPLLQQELQRQIVWPLTTTRDDGANQG